jgi:toxin FitB
MSYLLDTNVLSELARPKPNSNVQAWVLDTPNEALHISVLTLGELRNGIERLPSGQRREKLRVWIENDLPQWFGERVIPITTQVADRWGRLLATVKRPLPAVDSLTAATALTHGLRVVTRNIKEFALPGVEVVDPWEYGSR